MRYLITVLIALMFSACCKQAQADEWTGLDKKGHLLAGAGIAALTTVVTQDERWGVAAGCAAGVAKELYDSQHRDTHTPSFKDFAVTCLGAYVGSKTTGFVFNSTGIMYVHRF